MDKRLGLKLHHGAVNSVDALQLKGNSADGEFEKVGRMNDLELLGACTRRPNQY